MMNKLREKLSAKGDEYWWATLDILAGTQEKKAHKDVMADVDDWLAKLTAKIAKQRKIALKNAEKEQEEGNASKDGSGKKAAETKKAEVVPEYQYLQTSFGDHIEIEFSFSNPRVRSRLEKLMGSNVVRITDRKYMIKLQERIKEDHLENQKKRIKEREAEEVEREKKLILEGKIPIESAPKELKNHPVCKINQITKKILGDDKKGKSKPTSRATSSKSLKKMKECPDTGGVLNKKDDPNEVEENPSIDDADDCGSSVGKADEGIDCPDDINKDVLLKKDDYEKLKYEAPLVKTLRQVEDVGEMYKLAEEIVGPLKHQKTSKRRLRQDNCAPPLNNN